MNLKSISTLLIMSSALFIYTEVPLFVFLLAMTSLFLSYLPRKKIILANIYKVLVIAITLIYLFRKYHQFFNTEFGVSLVLIMSALKLWELETNKDYFNMFLILILLESSVLVVNPSVGLFLFSTLKIGIYFYFILKLQNYNLGILSIKRILVLILPSLIFSLLLYFTFPRFTQGFVGFNSPDVSLSTGSNSLSIAKLGDLNLSDSKVFTVYDFPTNIISQDKLYWRTVVLWDYFKNEWRNGSYRLKANANLPANLIQKNHYRVKTENLYMDYIPYFNRPSTINLGKQLFNYYLDNTYKIFPPHKSIFQYNVEFSPNDRFDLIASKIEIEKAIRLNSDPTIKEKILARLDLVNNNLTINEKLKAINNYFLKQKYEYSKSPPKYLSTEDFILTGKLGYCSHFASSYAYLLRLLNIPARIVIGYQGGEINPFDQSINVRERDAHAWVEFINEQGQWVSFDPTSLVNPERLTLGAFEFFNKLDPYVNANFLKIPKSFFQFKFLNTIDMWLSYVDSNLSNWLFNLDLNTQRDLFKNKSGIYFVAILITFLAIAYFISKNKFSLKISKEENRYRNFLIQMEKVGTKKLQHESITEFQLRAVLAHPEIREYIDEEVNAYLNFFYR